MNTWKGRIVVLHDRERPHPYQWLWRVFLDGPMDVCLRCGDGYSSRYGAKCSAKRYLKTRGINLEYAPPKSINRD